MYHAIHFDDSTKPSRNCDTYYHFGLISNGRPDVASPELKSTYVEVPGTDGSLDYTEALNGLTYQNRKGSWEFYVLNNYGTNSDWVSRWHSIMKALHGQYFDRIWLEDEGEAINRDPGYRMVWYYRGRITVNEWKSDPQFSKVVLDYVLEPYKRREPDEDEPEWEWDDLFGGYTVDPYIRLHKFSVNNTKQRTIVSDAGGYVTTTCSSQMTVKRTGSTEEPTVLPSGTTANAFSLNSGLNLFTFTGYGDIELSYDGSMMIL